MPLTHGPWGTLIQTIVLWTHQYVIHRIKTKRENSSLVSIEEEKYHLIEIEFIVLF
jgi:hypothetical protein